MSSKPVIIYIHNPKAKDERGLPNADAEITFAYNAWVRAQQADPSLSSADLSIVKVSRSGDNIIDTATGKPVPPDVTMTPVVYNGYINDFEKPGPPSVNCVLKLLRAWGVSVKMADLHPSLAQQYDILSMPPPQIPALAGFAPTAPPMPAMPFHHSSMQPSMPMMEAGRMPSGSIHQGMPSGGFAESHAASTPYHPLTPSYLKTNLCDDIGAIPTRESNAGAPIASSQSFDMSSVMKSRDSSVETLMGMQKSGSGFPGAMPSAPMPSASAGSGMSGGGAPGTLSGHFPAVENSLGAGRFNFRG